MNEPSQCNCSEDRSFLTISISYTSMIVNEPIQCSGSDRSFIPHYFHIVYFYDCERAESMRWQWNVVHSSLFPFPILLWLWTSRVNAVAVKGRSFRTISISYTSMIVYEPSQCSGSERSFIPHYFHIVYFYDYERAESMQWQWKVVHSSLFPYRILLWCCWTCSRPGYACTISQIDFKQPTKKTSCKTM
jgi:hypothetical protein